MPPPQPVLASKIRGFVCRSCRTKLQIQQQAPRLSRSLANQSQPGYQKGAEGKGKKKESEPTFRFFEETPDGRRKEIEGDDDFMGLRPVAEDPLSKEVAKSIATLNRETKSKKGSIMSRLKEMLGPLPLEEQERALEKKMIEEYGEELQDDDYLFEVPSDAKAFEIPLAPYAHILLTNDSRSRSYQAQVATLNERIRRVWDVFPDILQKSQDKTIPILCANLWRSYVLCRRALLSEPQEVPQDVWWLLWEVFSSPGAWNVDRLSHVKVLAEDMSQAGRILPDPARLLYIEAVFVSGDHERALDLWSKAENPFDESSESFKDYWELGTRMLAKDGQVDRAVQVAEILLGQAREPTDVRILLPIIRSCLVSDTTFAVQKAWALYIRLRYILGEQIQMQDYDAVISAFLEANETELALSAFTDMMLTGHKSAKQEDSTAVYKEVVGSRSDLGVVKIGKNEFEWEKSEVLTQLPKRFNNKIFFGSWIKKLIGDGEVGFAEKVLDLMYQRGIRPDAKYLNGLIGAWLREGSAQGQQKAEEMAWRMIRARLEFVKIRHLRSDSGGRPEALWRPTPATDRTDHRSAVLRLTPNANIETFAVLLESYRRRLKNEKLGDLFDTLEKAEVRPNTFFMNQLLSADIKTPQTDWAWDKYRFFVQEQGLRPDFDTFRCLWHLVRKQVDPLVKKQDMCTTPRMLFAEMVRHAPVLTNREEMPRELYDTILLAFGLADDQIGTAIAIRALQRNFNMYPNPNTARSVILQLARVGHQNSVGLRPRRLKLNSATKKRVDQVTKILEAFKNQRVKVLSRKAIVFDELRGEAKLEESLVLLCDVLRYTAKARIGGWEDGPGGLEELSQTAAEEMGVPGSTPWRDQERDEQDDGEDEGGSSFSSDR